MQRKLFWETLERKFEKQYVKNQEQIDVKSIASIMHNIIKRTTAIPTDRIGSAFSYNFNYSDATAWVKNSNFKEVTQPMLDYCVQMIESRTDDNIPVMIENLNEHYSKRGKNYVVSIPLMKALKATSINLPTSKLPDYFNGYFELKGFQDKDGEEVPGLWILIKRTGGVRFFQCFYYSRHNTSEELHLSSIVFNLDKSQNIEECILDCNNFSKRYEPLRAFKAGAFHKKKFIAIDDIHKASPLQRLIINIVIYVKNTSEDLNEEVNKFADKRKKQEAQKNIYTSEKFIPLGRNFEYLKLVSDESFLVKGHFRWQPCGKNWSKVKLTFINPHQRKLKRLNLS